MRGNRRFDRSIPILALGLLVLGVLVATPPATAQSVEVNSADPPGAPQGTVNLDVTIKGNGFGRDSQVKFLVTGTSDPGGIVVNSVKSKGSKTLVANIDVDAEAFVGDFDIEVMTAGRTGKGTELFAVSQGNGGGAPDTTPPGAVTDLTVGAVGFTTVEVTWTETADDGYDPSSGMVDLYRFYFRTDGPITESNLSSSTGFPDGVKYGVAPGGTLTELIWFFEPATRYYIVVTATDFAGNVSLVSNNVEVTTDPFPATPWTTEEIDRCPTNESNLTGATSGVDYDEDGNPAVLYSYICFGSGLTSKLAEWNGTEWASSLTGLQIDGAQVFAIDPSTDQPTLTSDGWGRLDFYRRVGTGWVGEVIERNNVFYGALEYDPLGVPAIAYKKKGKGKGPPSCNLARWDGASWASEVVDPDSYCREPRLAFDPLARPALVYEFLPSGPDLAVRFAHWDGVDWSRETVHVPQAGWSDNDPDLAFDVSSGTFSVAFSTQLNMSSETRSEPSGEVRFCERSGGTWSCEVVDRADWILSGADLVYDAAGTAYLAYEKHGAVQVAVRPAGTAAWTVEVVDWGHGLGRLALSVSPDGTVGLTYQADRDLYVTESFRFARRGTQ